VNARSSCKWTGSGPVTSPIWTGPIRTESVTPYLPSLDLYLLGYRGQKCRLHALTIQRRKIFIPPHSVTISELQLTTTDAHLLPRHCRHSGVKLPLRCRRRRNTQQSSSRSAAVLSHSPGVNFLPPTPHPTLPVDGRPLFSQRADCDQTPSLTSRRSSVVLSVTSRRRRPVRGICRLQRVILRRILCYIS